MECNCNCNGNGNSNGNGNGNGNGVSDIIEKHHILPKSRYPNGKTVKLHRGFHFYWHQLFYNMTIYEVHKFINIIMQENEVWTYKKLKNLRISIIKGENNKKTA